VGLSTAYGGGRFEFRAVGSSQNVSMVNTVLNTITAESMAVIADQIEGGASAQDAASATLEAHWRCIFNGDNYSDEWLEEAAARGVWYQNPPPHTHTSCIQRCLCPGVLRALHASIQLSRLNKTLDNDGA